MRYVVSFVLLVCGLSLYGQDFIQARALQVANNKTTNLVFPSVIQSVDRGSEKIIVQKATEYVLKVKADTAFSDTTTLTVITADGKLYSFLVSYSAFPAALNIDLSTTGMVNKDTGLIAIAEKALQARNYLHGVWFSSGKVRVSLVAVYSTGELLLCKLKIENKSSLSFQPGRLRCYQADARTLNRKPSQHTEIRPLLVYPANVTIKVNQAIVKTVIIPKTVLAPEHQLIINLEESNGERSALLRVPAKYLFGSMIIQ